MKNRDGEIVFKINMVKMCIMKLNQGFKLLKEKKYDMKFLMFQKCGYI